MILYQKTIFFIAKKSDHNDQYQINFDAKNINYEREYNKFYDYVESIDNQTSDETIVKEFNLIYKYIALSLETIE